MNERQKVQRIENINFQGVEIRVQLVVCDQSDNYSKDVNLKRHILEIVPNPKPCQDKRNHSEDESESRHFGNFLKPVIGEETTLIGHKKYKLLVACLCKDRVILVPDRSNISRNDIDCMFEFLCSRIEGRKEK